jgi:methyl-accepting chemotaxis protein
MAERSKTFMLNTLKGKVWLAVITLAVINCVVGVIAFIAASFLTTNSLAPVIATVACTSLTTIVFAWWMSNALMAPIDKLTLLAKGIERSPGMSLPKTTGSSETDELLMTISRTSQQLMNIIDLMDDVTAGKTDAALNPLEHSDRISTSFQKLVAKVTDSIDAKKDLDELRFAVNQLNNEVGLLQRGERVQVRREFESTKPVSDAFRSLIEKQSELTRGVNVNSVELRNLTADGKKRIRAVIEKDEARKRKFKTLSAAISDSNGQSDKSTRELSSALSLTGDLLDEINKGSISPAENAKALAAVRKQFDSALHKLRDVGEQSLAITHVSKSVQDLARRSNMIALNTSIQANGSDQTSGFSTLTQEITSLSERAEKANKAISGISDSVVRDVNDAHASLQWIASEVANISQRATNDEDAMVKITGVLMQLAELPAKIDLKSIERSVEIERMLQLLDDCSSSSEEVSADLQSCEANYLSLVEPVENLRASVSSRKQPIANISERTVNGANVLNAGSDPAASPAVLEIQGEN